MAACSEKELVFCVFMIHILAEHTGLTLPDIYRRLTDSGIMDDYIIPFYDVLHTLGELYLVNDITDLMRERGVLDEVQKPDTKHGMSCSREDLERISRRDLEMDIIKDVAAGKQINCRIAMDIYYRSELSKQISLGMYDIQDRDHHMLGEDLIEFESELFRGLPDRS